MAPTEFRVCWSKGRRFPSGPTAVAEFALNHFYIGMISLVATGEQVLYKGYLPTASDAYILSTELKRASAGEMEPRQKVPRFTWRQLEPHKLLTAPEDVRFPYQEALFRYFPDSIEGINKLDVASLAKLHRLLGSVPWLLCFKKWMLSFKGVKTLKPQACLEAVKEYGLNPDKTIADALIFYGALKREQEQLGDTLFPGLEQRTSAQVYTFLVENSALVETPWGPALYRDHAAATKLVTGVRRIIDNAAQLPPPTERGWIVPCAPCASLCPEQVHFLLAACNQPLCMLTAPPGSGKTAMISELNTLFARVLNVTFVGAMVESMQGRLGNHAGSVHTIHYIITMARYVKGAAEWLAQYEVIIVDEASNVDEKLLADLLAVVPNARKLIMVGDLEQIFPIDPGCPFHNLVQWLGCERLVKNHRVDPAFVALASANAAIRDNELDALVFSPQGPLRIHERSSNMMAVLKLALSEFQGLSSIADVQLVTLRNDDRAKLNEAVEHVALDMGLIATPRASQIVKLTAKMDLFPGKKIKFLSTHKSTSADLAAVRNGEIVIIQSCYKQGADIVIVTTRGKQILVSKTADNAVKPHEIDMAYCVTCNSSQGSEWNHVLFWMPASTVPFTREFAYVAFSRARKDVTLVGLLGELRQLCRGRARARQTLLSHMLAQLERPAAQAVPRTGLRPIAGLQVALPKTPEAQGLFPVHQAPLKEPKRAKHA